MNGQPNARVILYVGTYTQKGSAGIYIFDFDPVTGETELLGTAQTPNPSFLAIHPSKKYLYAVNELTEFEGAPGGAVSAFAIDPHTGLLTLINQQPSHGTYPCHVTVSPDGAYAFVANYGSGSAAVYPVREDGGLAPASDIVQHEGSGPNPRRQEGPHAHSVTLDPDGRRAYVADLGIDRLMIYDIASEPGKLRPNTPPYVAVAGGSGPRHMAFHPSGRFAYLINEMGNTIIAFAYDSQTGGLQALQTVPTLPEGYEGPNTTADIHILPAGDFLYGSNRGHDSLAVYAIDQATGKLNPVGHVASGGHTPRNFAIAPVGAYLLAANQDSDNVVFFKVDPRSGMPQPAGQELEISMPVCVKFMVR